MYENFHKIRFHTKNISLNKICFLLLIITFVGFSLAYSLSTPVYEGPDEEAHYQYSINAKDALISLPNSIVQSGSLYYLVTGEISNLVNQHDDNIAVNYGYPFDYKGKFHHGPKDVFPYTGLALEIHILRIISIFCGIVTIIFTYKISKIIFDKNKWLPLFSTALVSLTPSFIWINSVMNTDVFVWMFSTIAIFFITRFIKENFKFKLIIYVAIFTGLAILSKINGYFIYTIVFSVLLYLALSRQISPVNFFKHSGLFLSISILSGAFWLPLKIINIFYVKKSADIIYELNILPNSGYSGFNYINEHWFSFDFLHNRLIEFSLSGMGQNVIWIPKIYFFIADGFLAFSLIGIFYVVIKREYHKFNINKNYLVLFLAPIFALSFMFYNWFFSEIGIARYTFPIISIFGIIFTVGFFAFIRKKLTPLLFTPLLFLVFVNIMNINTIQNELSFDLEDSDGDGIPNDLDIKPLFYSNKFSDGKLGGTTDGVLERIDPANITDSNSLKKEILSQIRRWSPSFDYLLALVPSDLYNYPDNRKLELRNALSDLERDGKIFSHGDAWTIAVHKIWMQKEENGIRIRNDDANTFQPIQIDTCNDKLILNHTNEVIFSCDGGLKIIHPVLKLPFGIKDGDLIQGKNQAEVYLIQNGNKHHIRTIETFKQLGFTPDMIKFVPKEIFDEIPTGAPI
jgi:hypothetical protein